MGPPVRASSRRWIVIMTVLAVPATIALESVLRALITSDDLRAIQVMLEPTMTRVAWGLCAIAALLSALALAVGLRRAQGSRLGVGAYLLLASVSQAPALLGALTPLLGASIRPVLLGAGISTASIVLLALRITPETPS